MAAPAACQPSRARDELEQQRQLISPAARRGQELVELFVGRLGHGVQSAGSPACRSQAPSQRHGRMKTGGANKPNAHLVPSRPNKFWASRRLRLVVHLLA